jgi:NAD+ synthase
MEGTVACSAGEIEYLIRFALWGSGRKGIVIGLSGGLDSSLCAALCCRAVSPERVLGIIMPSRVTFAQDIEDATGLAESLGIGCRLIDIEPVLDAYRRTPGFEETPVAMGNLMARTRMAYLYYTSNREDRIVCGTSNRTESLLGYFTKFGDGAGDIEPIIHLYKTEVYDLARHLGIPDKILKKPPSAGLWPGQRDEEEIGIDYPTLDAALQNLERNGWISSKEVEEKVLSMVRASEHKRVSPVQLPRRDGGSLHNRGDPQDI